MALQNLQKLFYVFGMCTCLSSCFNSKTKVIAYYPNGDVKEKIEMDDDGFGLETDYYSDGIIMCQINIKKDSLRHGEARFFYPSGKLKLIRNYIDGKSYGKYQSFYENGGINKDAQYVRDSLAGEFREYFQDGKIHLIAFFNNGIQQSYKEFNKNGELTDASPYVSITSVKDTISVGDTYKATIKLNFPPKGDHFLMSIRRFDDTTVWDPIHSENYIAELLSTSKTLGHKTLKGSAVIYNDNETAHEFYFDINYWVKNK